METFLLVLAVIGLVGLALIALAWVMIIGAIALILHLVFGVPFLGAFVVVAIVAVVWFIFELVA